MATMKTLLTIALMTLALAGFAQRGPLARVPLTQSVPSVKISCSMAMVLQSSPDLQTWTTISALAAGQVATISMNSSNCFFRGVVTNGTVNLTWNPDTSEGVAGYKIYTGPASRVYTTTVDVGGSTTVALPLPFWSTNYVAATCYDEAGMESDYSDEVTFSAPAPVVNISK